VAGTADVLRFRNHKHEVHSITLAYSITSSNTTSHKISLKFNITQLKKLENKQPDEKKFSTFTQKKKQYRKQLRGKRKKNKNLPFQLPDRVGQAIIQFLDIKFSRKTAINREGKHISLMTIDFRHQDRYVHKN